MTKQIEKKKEIPLCRKRSGLIRLNPNPILVQDFGKHGVTTLSWSSIGTKQIEVHLGAPNGPLFHKGGPTGHIDIKSRVMRNDMVIFLQDTSNGLPLTKENTLDTITGGKFNTRFITDSPIRLPDEFSLSYSAKNHKGKALVAGWFSFKYGGTTAGDLMASKVVCNWLKSKHLSYDIALCDSFPGGVDWHEVNPRDYSYLVFVCGPFKKGSAKQLLERFSNCCLVGVDLSMLQPPSISSPFDILLERDSSAKARAEISFATRQSLVPIVGVIPVEPIAEYPERAMQDVANKAIRRLISMYDMSIVEIDTRLPGNLTGLRSPAEIESLIARMDLVLTTRLHGLILALKNGIPVIAIDPHAGGSKVRRQAETIGWPIIFNPEKLTDRALREAFNYCLTKAARRKAKECAAKAISNVEKTRDEFLAELERIKKNKERMKL